MNKEEYLKIKNDQKADKLPILYFFAKLKGLKGVDTIEQFGAYFHKWIVSLMRHPADLIWLKQIHYYVDVELDKHFNVVNGI